jgi:Cdc6-like AAA superfamily ATPase
MASDKNRHITEYLTYYLGLAHSPNYAVMLTGPWGIGKTYVVKDYLRRFVEGKKKYVYVSLFGLSTINEIDEAVFQAIYPLLAKKATKIGARVAKTLLTRAGFDPQFKLDEVLNKFNAEIYIFDDLERCEAPINKVLG